MAPLPLHRWYVEALSPVQAEQWLHQLRASRRSISADRGARLSVWIREVTARCALSMPIELHYRDMKEAAVSRREQALVELVYGQALISQRLRAGLSHLDAGLRLAHDIIATADYFTLVKRHELLSELPLGDDPAPPQGLSALLVEAGVIRRLKAARTDARRYIIPHRADTLG
jgi:hypothetical protein